MTPDQIRTLAKQAGGDYDTDDNDPMALVMFYRNELAAFVRLVREGDRIVMEQALVALQPHKSNVLRWVTPVDAAITALEGALK